MEPELLGWGPASGRSTATFVIVCFNRGFCLQISLTWKDCIEGIGGAASSQFPDLAQEAHYGPC